MARRRSNPAGFTLLELVLVLVVLSIGLAMAVPMMGGFLKGSQFNDTADEFVAVTQHARTQAVSESRRYRLNIETDGRSFYLTAENGQQFAELETEFKRKFLLPDFTTIELRRLDGEAERYVEFRPDSSCDPASVKLHNAVTGADIVVECATATEMFRVVSGGRGGVKQ